MTHRTTETDIGGIFSSRDSADCELRYALIALTEIAKDFDSFTAEQGRDLLAMRNEIDDMIMRVEQ